MLLKDFENNNIKFIPQGDKFTYYPMLKKEDGLINFNSIASSIVNLIKGLYIWPNAYFYLNNKIIKVFNAEVVSFESSLNAGQVVLASKLGLIIKCGENSYIKINELQIEGGKRLIYKDFLNGNKIEVGTVLNGNIA